MDRHTPSLLSTDGSADRAGSHPALTMTGALQQLTANGKAAIASLRSMLNQQIKASRVRHGHTVQRFGIRQFTVQ